MLKRLSVLFTVGIVLFLVACGGRTETTTRCVVDGIDFYGEILPGSMETEIDAVGDRVTATRQRWTFDLSEDVEDIEISELVAILEEEIELMLMFAVDGITSEIAAVTDTSVTWLTTTDFDAMSEEDLQSYLQGYDFISLELTVEQLESDGATCVVAP